MKYRFKPTHILFLIALIGILGLIELMFSPYDNYKEKARLQHTLTQEKWVPFSDKELGFSFDYPESWKVTKNSPSDYGSRYGINIYDGQISFVSIYKNPNLDQIQSLLENTSKRFEQPQTRVINGSNYTVLQNDENIRRNIKSGVYMISADKDVLIYIILGSQVDNGLSVQQAEDKVVDRIISSLKSI